jgi:hypothetical protein
MDGWTDGRTDGRMDEQTDGAKTNGNNLILLRGQLHAELSFNLNRITLYGFFTFMFEN